MVRLPGADAFCANVTGGTRRYQWQTPYPSPTALPLDGELGRISRIADRDERNGAMRDLMAGYYKSIEINAKDGAVPGRYYGKRANARAQEMTGELQSRMGRLEGKAEPERVEKPEVPEESGPSEFAETEAIRPEEAGRHEGKVVYAVLADGSIHAVRIERGEEGKVLAVEEMPGGERRVAEITPEWADSLYATANGARASVEGAKKSKVSEQSEESEISKEGDNGLADVVRTIYEKGKKAAEQIFKMKHFTVAKTSELLKRIGLSGERFTIRYGVLSRHIGKDSAHSLPVEVWEKLPEALNHPILVSKYFTDESHKEQKGYRIYTRIRLESGEFVTVGAEVVSNGRNVELNKISTVFGRDRFSATREEVVYEDKEAPEYQSLLNGHNPHQYPDMREHSGDKGSALPENKQGEGEKSSEEMLVDERVAKHGGERRGDAGDPGGRGVEAEGSGDRGG